MQMAGFQLAINLVKNVWPGSHSTLMAVLHCE